MNNEPKKPMKAAPKAFGAGNRKGREVPSSPCAEWKVWDVVENVPTVRVRILVAITVPDGALKCA